jgi:hypothetical protein
MRVLDTIYCDDVREESGGKHTLVGMYENVVQIPVARDSDNPKFPVSLFIRFMEETRGQPFKTIELEFEYNQTKIASVTAPVNFGPGPVHCVAARRILVPIGSGGVFSVKVMLHGSGAETISLESPNKLFLKICPV